MRITLEIQFGAFTDLFDPIIYCLPDGAFAIRGGKNNLNPSSGNFPFSEPSADASHFIAFNRLMSRKTALDSSDKHKFKSFSRISINSETRSPCWYVISIRQ